MKIGYNREISTFWGISTIIILSMVVVFVFYFLYFFWIENPTPTSNILVVRAFQRRAISIPDTVDTAALVSYADFENKFSLYLPVGYSVNYDEIYYGETPGTIVTFSKSNAESFSMRIFSAQENTSIEDSFRQITNVELSPLQWFSEEVDGREAVVYRMQPGDPNGDQLYFLWNGMLFEVPFNERSVQVLATFEFLD
ncbi:MAG: hypothetical protein WC505_05215 [Patescibacteria group bacterium]